MTHFELGTDIKGENST